MTNKLFCSLRRRLPISRRALLLAFCATATLVECAPSAVAAGDAPAWMHSRVNATLPAYDEKNDAVLLYSETDVTVIATDKIRTTVREAYKILRPGGRHHGTVSVFFNPERKIKSLH